MLEEEDSDVEKILISFKQGPGFTDESLKVPSVPIAVPSQTRRKGLSAIVNHLLDRRVVSDDKNKDEEKDETLSSDEEGNDKLPAIPFDFLLNNKLLRMSIESASRKEGLSLEDVVVIHYFPSRASPTNEKQSELLPDWIYSIAHHTASQTLCTGGGDGNIRIYDNCELSEIHEISAHSGPIKCISTCSTDTITDTHSTDNDENSLLIASGSMDQTLLTHTYSKAKKDATLHAVYTKGHATSLSSANLLHQRDSSTLLASGDWGGNFCVWKVPNFKSPSESAAIEADDCRNTKKKAKIAKDKAKDRNMSVEEVSPIACIKGHANNISGIVWMHGGGSETRGSNLITSSYDHSIKSWDIENQDNIVTLNGSKVVSCLGRCHNSDVVASGHPNCTVRLWDMRKSTSSIGDGNFFDGTLRPSHKAWISSVNWSPTDPYLLASASYDGTVRLWDIRSSLPLYTIRAHEDKQKSLCLSFTRDAIFSAGSDCVIKKFNFSGR